MRPWVDVGLPVVAVCLVVAMFVVLFMQTLSLGWQLDRLEQRGYARAAPDASTGDDAEPSRALRAYTARADMHLTVRLNSGQQPPLRDDMYLTCNGLPRSGPADHRKTAWLALKRTGQTSSLYNAAVGGAVRFAAIGGAVCRLHAVQPETGTGTADAALTSKAVVALGGSTLPSSAYFFVLGDALNGVPAGVPADAGCAAAVMPVMHNFDALQARLKTGGNDAAGVPMQIWAWG
jgi:hypothetical protein